MKRLRVLVLAGMIFILSGCGSQEPEAHYIETPSPDAADSFRYESENYFVDIDGDGKEELIYNHVSGGDGHAETYVFKHEGKGTLIGFVNWLDLDLPGLNYWGVNAVQTYYDNAYGKILVGYYDTNENVHKNIPIEFDKLEFIQWEEGDELPFIDIDEAFELFG